MQKSTSNPISVNQIVDTNLDLKCLTPSQCRTLTDDIQVLINDYCANKFDQSKIIQGCLTTFPDKFDLHFLLNKIIAKLCLPISNSSTVDLGTINLTGINFCPSGDNWDTTKPNCLLPVDSCDNSIVAYTIYDVFRALINRIIAMEVVIKQLKAINDAQQITINTHTSQIQDIINNCCSIALVNEIQILKNRLQAAGIP